MTQKLEPVVYTFANSSSGDTGAWKARSLLFLSEELTKTYECALELGIDISEVAISKGDELSDDIVDALTGDSCTLTMERKDGSKRYLHGIIHDVEQVGTFDDQFHIIVRIVPALYYLQHRKNSRIFQNKTVPAVLEEMLDLTLLEKFSSRKVSLAAVKESDYVERVHSTQHAESDLGYMTRLMVEEGISYYFNHAPVGPGEVGQEELVLFDNNDDLEEMISVPISKDVGIWECVYKLSKRSGDTTTSIVTLDLDRDNPKKQNKGEKKGTTKKDQDLESFVWKQKSYAVANVENHVKRMAKVQKEARLVQEREAGGLSNVLWLQPGMRVPIGKSGQKYLITRVRSEGSNADGTADSSHKAALLNYYSHYDEAKKLIRRAAGAALPGVGSNYENEFDAIPDAVTYRTPFHFMRGLTSGAIGNMPPQLARVTGGPNKEIDTPEGGEIKVKIQFYWDRYGEYNEKSSAYLPVVQPWAGMGFGAAFVPRVGTEVLVIFVDGNPDLPVIIGCLHDGANPLFIDAQSENTKTGISTKSTKEQENQHSLGGRHELIFEDQDQKEYFYMRSEKDMVTDVKDNRVTIVGKLLQEARGAPDYNLTSEQLNALEVTSPAPGQDAADAEVDAAMQALAALPPAVDGKYVGMHAGLKMPDSGTPRLTLVPAGIKAAPDEKAPEVDKATEGNELKLVMGHQKVVVKKHRDLVVEKNRYDYTGAHRAEFVGGNFIQNIKGAKATKITGDLFDCKMERKYEVIGGTEFKLAGGAKSEVYVGFSQGIYFGLKAELFFGTKFDISHSATLSMTEGIKVEKSREKVINCGEDERTFFYEQGTTIASSDAVRVWGGSDKNEEDLSSEFKAASARAGGICGLVGTLTGMAFGIESAIKVGPASCLPHLGTSALIAAWALTQNYLQKDKKLLLKAWTPKEDSAKSGVHLSKESAVLWADEGSKIEKNHLTLAADGKKVHMESAGEMLLKSAGEMTLDMKKDFTLKAAGKEATFKIKTCKIKAGSKTEVKSGKILLG